jgi:glyoxylase-like metal-dependent hydrolase (beta-lactamase superfamily II)
MEQHKDIVISACKGRDVRLIVLTHGHLDHIQNAAALSKELNAPIAIHKADYELANNNMAEIMYADNFMGKLIVYMNTKMLARVKIEPFEPDVYLNDGDTLDGYGVRATVVGLPGHTKGSVGVLVEDTDLFVGDALMNMVRPRKTLLYGNKDDMFKSCSRISTYKGVTVHFGHGKSVANRNW